MNIDEAQGRIELGGVWLDEGAVITLDGNNGRIFAGEAQIIARAPQDLLARLDELHCRR